MHAFEITSESHACLWRASLLRFFVRLSRKLEKLFSIDAVQSLWEHICRWTHPVNARRILATIDQEELERLRRHYPYRPNARRINAYEDAAYWIGVNIKHVQDLWLDRAPPLQILDLGCGAGYFLYLCRLFGHEGLGIDTGEDPFFGGTTQFLGVHRVIARITAQTPLPDLGKRFDRTVLHFLPRSWGLFSSRKVRAFFAAKPCSRRTLRNDRASNRSDRNIAPRWPGRRRCVCWRALAPRFAAL